jgi:tRNA A-37 threonylcarbamoyl transferase component Bud32
MSNILEENNILPEFYFKMYRKLKVNQGNNIKIDTKKKLFELFTKYINNKTYINLLLFGKKLINVYTEKSIINDLLKNKINQNSIQNIHSEFWGSKYTKTTLRHIKLKDGREKIYKFIVDKKKNIKLLIVKTFIEYVIQTILNYIYTKYLPKIDYLAFYKTHITKKNSIISKILETEKLYIVMDYIKGETLKEFFKNIKTRITDESIRDKIIIDILLYLSEILYTYQFRCNFVHGDLTPDNIIINFDYIYNVIHDLKIIDFGSSSIQVKINKKSVLIFDNSKKSNKTYLDTLSSFTNRSFALSSDLFYFYILILFHSSYGLNIMSDNLRSKLIRIFDLKDINYIEEYKKYAMEYYYRQHPNNKNLAERNIEYYVKSYPIKFLCKLKYFRNHFFGIEYYKFHPILFRNNLLKNLNWNIDFFNHNSLNENIQLKNIINRIEFKTKLEYLQIYGINNIFGINTKIKLILLDLIFATLYSNDINEKCKYMDIMNLLIADSINNNNQYNINKKLTIGKGLLGSVNYIDINNKVIKKQSYNNINSIIIKIFEYIISYYISSSNNIAKTYCTYIKKNKIDILIKKVNGKSLSSFLNNTVNLSKQSIVSKIFSEEVSKKNKNNDIILIKVLINICIVLIELHKKFKFIHRDLNTENIFLNNDLYITFIDFGTSSIYINTPFGKKLFTNFYRIYKFPSTIINFMKNNSNSSDIMFLLIYIINAYKFKYNNKFLSQKIISDKLIDELNNLFFNNKLSLNQNKISISNLFLITRNKFKRNKFINNLNIKNENLFLENFNPLNAKKMLESLLNKILI